MTHVLDDGCQGDHDVGEGVAVNGAEVGIGDVLELGALEVALLGLSLVPMTVSWLADTNAVCPWHNRDKQASFRPE